MVDLEMLDKCIGALAASLAEDFRNVGIRAIREAGVSFEDFGEVSVATVLETKDGDTIKVSLTVTLNPSDDG